MLYQNPPEIAHIDDNVSNYRDMATLRAFNALHRRCAIISSMSNTYALNRSSIVFNVSPVAPYCTKKSVARASNDSTDNKVQIGYVEVVKEKTKLAFYLVVVMIGIGLTGTMFYIIFNDLFSSESPNGIYNRTLKICTKHERVLDALGEPIKAYGEESRRGRRNYISNKVYTANGVQRMEMKFYIQGIRRRGTVLLEVEKNDSGQYEYRYLYVVVSDMMNTVIKIEDNRNQQKIYDSQSELQSI